MKNRLAAQKLITSIFATGLLLYFMSKSVSPDIIFVPFLICSISLACKSIAQILNKEKWSMVFHKLFVLGFILFWVGFLVAACFISIRDKNYSLLIFSLPFWLIGIYLIKNKLLGKKGKKNARSPLYFKVVISAALVIIALLTGILLLVLGYKGGKVGLIFAGMFFIFGSFTFVLAGLTIGGYFDKFKIDVLGMYMGFLLVGIGIGAIALKFGESYSLSETIQSLGFWIVIPVLMTMAGIIQIIKCLKNRK